MEDQIVSYREFARLMNTTEGTVRRRIYKEDTNPTGILIAGRTTNPVTQKPALLFNIAAEEWRAHFDLSDAELTDRPAADAEKQRIQKERVMLGKADKHITSVIHEADERTVRGKPSTAKVVDGDADSIAQLRKGKLLYEFRTAKLLFEQKSGILVNKNDVYKALNEWSTIARTKLQQAPDTLLQDLMPYMVEGCQPEVLNLIATAYEAFLVDISTPPNLDPNGIDTTGAV